MQKKKLFVTSALLYSMHKAYKATIFFGKGELGHEFPKVPQQYFVKPLFDDWTFYDPQVQC